MEVLKNTMKDQVLTTYRTKFARVLERIQTAIEEAAKHGVTSCTIELSYDEDVTGFWYLLRHGCPEFDFADWRCSNRILELNW